MVLVCAYGGGEFIYVPLRDLNGVQSPGNEVWEKAHRIKSQRTLISILALVLPTWAGPPTKLFFYLTHLFISTMRRSLG